MSKRRFIAVGVAVLSVCLLATPASAKSKTVYKSKGKALNAVITDCPANASPGTRCAAWLVYASQFRVRDDGTVDRFGTLALDKYRIKITATGFEPIFVASGVGAPSSLQVSDNLSSGSASGTVEVTYFDDCDPQGDNCRTKLIPIAVSLSANAPADFQKGKVITKFDECRIVERFNDRTRTAEGTATVNGISFVTTTLGPFLSSIDRSTYTSVSRGSCALPPPVV